MSSTHLHTREQTVSTYTEVLTSRRDALVAEVGRLNRAIAILSPESVARIAKDHANGKANGNGKNGHRRKARASLTATAWESARREYEGGRPVVAIARKFGVTPTPVYGRIKREGWARSDTPPETR